MRGHRREEAVINKESIFKAGLRQVPGEIFSTLTAPDDYVLVRFY
jgi:hypothetical protein